MTTAASRRSSSRYARPVKPTTDLCDELGDDALVVEAPLADFGGRRCFSGPAATVRTFENNVLVREAFEEPGAGRVLVVDAGGSTRCALLGDRMATLAAQNGWAGIVISGCVRDTAELAAIDFGVKAVGRSPRRSRKDDSRGHRDVPVRIGGVTINPGDHVYADDDGVVVVRAGDQPA